MIFQEVYNDVISSFGSLWNYKERGDSLEIITPFATTSNKFVSVFISKQGSDFVVSDGGWIDEGVYGNIFDRNIECYGKIIAHYCDSYAIKEIRHPQSGISFFYKKISKQTSVPSLIFDIANFISTVVSASEIDYEREKKTNELFSKSANDFLSSMFVDKVGLGEFLDKTTRHVKPNAIVKKDNGKLLLINYITGSTPDYFRTSIAKTTVVFELSDKSLFKNSVEKKVAFVDDQSSGFQPSKVSVWLDNLLEKPFIARINWSRKEQLLEL